MKLRFSNWNFRPRTRLHKASALSIFQSTRFTADFESDCLYRQRARPARTKADQKYANSRAYSSTRPPCTNPRSRAIRPRGSRFQNANTLGPRIYKMIYNARTYFGPRARARTVHPNIRSPAALRSFVTHKAGPPASYRYTIHGVICKWDPQPGPLCEFCSSLENIYLICRRPDFSQWSRPPPWERESYI